MTVTMKDFAEGCSYFLCGSYFEHPENPDEKFRHEERVACIECFNWRWPINGKKSPCKNKGWSYQPV